MSSLKLLKFKKFFWVVGIVYFVRKKIMLYFFLWIILSFVVASMGSDRTIGFGGALICSLIFSPLIGILIVLASSRKSDVAIRRKILDKKDDADINTKIQALKELRDSGAWMRKNIEKGWIGYYLERKISAS